MAVKMRLTRMGDKKSPFYRVVVIDSHKARDGQYVDLVGTYDPLRENGLKIDVEKAKKWISCGVQPTETVRALLIREGVIEGKAGQKKAAAEPEQSNEAAAAAENASDEVKAEE